MCRAHTDGFIGQIRSRIIHRVRSREQNPLPNRGSICICIYRKTSEAGKMSAEGARSTGLLRSVEKVPSDVDGCANLCVRANWMESTIIGREDC